MGTSHWTVVPESSSNSFSVLRLLRSAPTATAWESRVRLPGPQQLTPHHSHSPSVCLALECDTRSYLRAFALVVRSARCVLPPALLTCQVSGRSSRHPVQGIVLPSHCAHHPLVFSPSAGSGCCSFARLLAQPWSPPRRREPRGARRLLTWPQMWGEQRSWHTRSSSVQVSRADGSGL